MNSFEINQRVKTYFGKKIYIKSIGEENYFCVEKLEDETGWYYSEYDLELI
ncbi:hypothetical protein HYI05_16990 [Clostridium botulinum]|uniref:Cysteine synthase n=1 Tax=Clostridium botulinum TaxID=1491 RepID=A0A0A0UX90_CLOBO|nr:hypothetical protein [Clostridium botulinum]AIW54585.1 cysteine synthase [Clostridium botulinum]AIW54705.1 cysteine synthase [Clostridium botulinum]AIW54767.1 cysteine synthase [Clostridium botulinum]AIW54834.1 cysteine synthase [Clostridium botulinum]MBY7009293.1 hypothetical protein [Clostridium botulinum]